MGRTEELEAELQEAAEKNAQLRGVIEEIVSLWDAYETSVEMNAEQPYPEGEKVSLLLLGELHDGLSMTARMVSTCCPAHLAKHLVASGEKYSKALHIARGEEEEGRVETGVNLSDTISSFLLKVQEELKGVDPTTPEGAAEYEALLREKVRQAGLPIDVGIVKVEKVPGDEGEVEVEIEKE